MFWARASAPRAAPTSRARSGSQEQPSAEAVGKQVAGSLARSPASAPRSGCLRSPCGPSDSMTASMPSSLTGAVCQKSEPRHSAAFCGTLSPASSAAIDSSSAMAAPFCSRAAPWRRSAGRAPSRACSTASRRRATRSQRAPGRAGAEQHLGQPRPEDSGCPPAGDAQACHDRATALSSRRSRTRSPAAMVPARPVGLLACDRARGSAGARRCRSPRWSAPGTARGQDPGSPGSGTAAASSVSAAAPDSLVMVVTITPKEGRRCHDHHKRGLAAAGGARLRSTRYIVDPWENCS